ncbi:MAG: CaiB/BaiF CoA transferase family protein, partial [Advenella sp.]
GLRVVEFAGLGPGPFACMLLSDMGADVVTVDRPGGAFGDKNSIVNRGRTLVHANLKDPASLDQIHALVKHADVLVEGFRPGVMERLGFGPELVMEQHKRLIYARMTGWGQCGPLAKTAGHDINYISLTGALDAIGAADGPPVPPLNLVGDYGGGALYLVVGILAALYETSTSGRGQVIDAAITDGSLSMMTHFMASGLKGTFVEQRGKNMLDGGAPYYGVYETADKRHISVGAIEPQFFSELCKRLELTGDWVEAQNDQSRWTALRAEMARIFSSRTRDEWVRIFDGSDACLTPVLSLSEASSHPHNIARQSVVDIHGVVQPAPAPRFSRTLSAIQGLPPSHVDAIGTIIARWREAREFQKPRQ